MAETKLDLIILRNCNVSHIQGNVSHVLLFPNISSNSIGFHAETNCIHISKTKIRSYRDKLEKLGNHVTI